MPCCRVEMPHHTEQSCVSKDVRDGISAEVRNVRAHDNKSRSYSEGRRVITRSYLAVGLQLDNLKVFQEIIQWREKGRE